MLSLVKFENIKKVNKINSSSKWKSKQSLNLKSEKDMTVYMNTVRMKIRKSKYLFGPRQLFQWLAKHQFEDRKKKINNSSKWKSNQLSNLKSEKDMTVYMNTVRGEIRKSKYLFGPRQLFSWLFKHQFEDKEKKKKSKQNQQFIKVKK
jgi:hypothetical protein